MIIAHDLPISLSSKIPKVIVKQEAIFSTAVDKSGSTTPTIYS
jgi:hypothetical protein